ncbi:hypothetical protein LPU83_pLPU83c_0104 (plasmid) [Rhizobium favelukesii]|uniref:Uncharacterized protein n=1 Tax=Rhizobium favelukesii TaxID=348824 RepID=W6S2P0_9HYPH|nr:hypothetical protein LPU83_pLPU83c_0104 [Rhizobium favelukesii]
MPYRHRRAKTDRIDPDVMGYEPSASQPLFKDAENSAFVV